MTPQEKAIETRKRNKALTALYKKQESGEVSPAQAKAQLATLSSLLTAEKLKDSLDMWTNI